jgi:hypothetical protein
MAQRKSEPDLIRYISGKDIEIVKGRIPEEFRYRLRDVFINYTSFGGKQLGWVTSFGRRDINLCAFLPHRISLGRYLTRGQKASEFGGTARGQWIPWAVRRFLLYEVFFHEVGHLQIIHPRNSNNNRKFASETKAQEFADNLRRELWKTSFEHPDPVHNSPQPDELSIFPLWQNLDKKQRFNLVDKVVQAPYEQLPDLTEFGKLDEIQEKFLTRALCFS